MVVWVPVKVAGSRAHVLSPIKPESGANMQAQDYQKSSYLYEIYTEWLYNFNLIFKKILYTYLD